jgi:deazaflavin-dependent oxidoreductase (nitroreductase family)
MSTPESRLQSMATGLHAEVYRATSGLIGGFTVAPIALPIGLLTTRGRRTGLERVTPLNFLPDGERFVIVASNGGSPTDPQWYRNLEASPEASFQVGPRVQQVRPETASGSERDRLWALISFWAPMYALYSSRTTRQIPVVVLDPVAG